MQAVLAQKPAPDEVVVVIDHNSDLLARASEAFVEARVVANCGERGLSGARNTGIKESTGDLIVFLDDDACPRAGWLSALRDVFVDEAVIGAGGLTHPDWEQTAPTWFPEEFLWVIGCSYRGLPHTAAEIRNPLGANMAFRREVFDHVGGFTDGIGRIGQVPLGCEETELSIRARSQVGGRIMHVPGAAIDHLVPADRTQWRYFRRRCWAEGLSKALVAQSVGGDDALKTERAYVLKTLPAGVARGVVDMLRGDFAGLQRSCAIVAGLAITAAGYLRGRVATW